VSGPLVQYAIANRQKFSLKHMPQGTGAVVPSRLFPDGRFAFRSWRRFFDQSVFIPHMCRSFAGAALVHALLSFIRFHPTT
jgi:hypothetical protein